MIADQITTFLSRHGLPRRGWVVTWQGAPCGWMSSLDGPQAWRPGCIAVEIETGAEWRAAGGDAHAGAQRWEALECTPA